MRKIFQHVSRLSAQELIYVVNLFVWCILSMNWGALLDLLHKVRLIDDWCVKVLTTLPRQLVRIERATFLRL